jgi:hypothetical protein
LPLLAGGGEMEEEQARNEPDPAISQQSGAAENETGLH